MVGSTPTRFRQQLDDSHAFVGVEPRNPEPFTGFCSQFVPNCRVAAEFLRPFSAPAELVRCTQVKSRTAPAACLSHREGATNQTGLSEPLRTRRSRADGRLLSFGHGFDSLRPLQQRAKYTLIRPPLPTVKPSVWGA